ncbi:MAG: carbohydrate kinase family protein, partial [Alkalispirochaeta sp.]
MLDVTEIHAHNHLMDAVVAGHICIDLTPGLHGHQPVRSVAELMRPGGLVDVTGLTVSPGGAVSNTGLSLARMGIEVGLIGRVGADPLAEMLRRELAVAGVSARLKLVEDASAGTSYSVILPIPGLDRIFLHDAGANDTFSVRDLAAGFTAFGLTEGGQGRSPGGADDAAGRGETPRIMHFGYPTAVASMFRTGPAPLREVLTAARRRGMTVSVDFSLPDPEGEAAAAPWREILHEAMPLTDLCFPSVEELSLMIDPAGFRERERSRAGAQAFAPDYGYALAGELVAMGAAVVAVKLGGRGLLLRWDPARQARLGDTGAITLGERLPDATEAGGPSATTGA